MREQPHPVAGRLLHQPQGGVAVLDPVAGQPFEDCLRPRLIDERLHLLRPETSVERGGIEYLSARRQEPAGRIERLVGLDQARIAGGPAATGNHQVEGRARRHLEPGPHPLDGSAVGLAPRPGHGPCDPALPSLDQAYGAVRRTQVGRAHDLLRHRVSLEHSGLAARVAFESAAEGAQHQGVVGLDLLVAADAREDHFRPAPEPGEVVMAHRADGHEELGLDGGPVQPQRDPLAQLADSHEIVRGAAVVFEHPDTFGNRAEEVPDSLLPHRGMGAVGNDDRDRGALDAGPPQSFENHGQDLRQVRVAGRVGHDHRHAAPAGRELGERQTVERLVQSRSNQSREVATTGRRARCQRTHLHPAQVKGHAVIAKREFDNHGGTIAS